MSFVTVEQIPLTSSDVRGLFVSAALIYLLAVLTILDASELDFQLARSSLTSVIIPLLATFFGIVLITSLRIIFS